MKIVREKLELARRELLDLGLRNTLINYRTLKARGLDVIDEKPEHVYQILVTQGKTMSFQNAPEPEEESNDLFGDMEILFEQPEEKVNEKGIALRHIDDKLQTPYTSKKLQRRLLNTFYAARTSIEEQGVNTLYLALGMLHWYEADVSDISRRAPLLLIPVTLYRTDVQARFRLRYNGEDIGSNLSLQAKLKQEFGITLPAIEESEDLDVERYFDAVAHAVAPQTSWSVKHDAIALGFFSFNKFLMFNDLDPANWSEDHAPHEHDVLQALLEDGFEVAPSLFTDDAFLDDHLSPAGMHTVVDADSSQTIALDKIKRGRHLVIQGPPGTGKSQTITNIIAEAVGAGKTVLFVSEKMAALEVVKRRLDGVGIGDACLELHSNKTNKRAFLQELKRTLNLDKPLVDDHDDKVAQLLSDRDRLNDYSRAVNTTIGASGVTPYQAYGHLLKLNDILRGVERPAHNLDNVASWDGPTFKRRVAIAEEMQALLVRIGVPEQHLFWGSKAKTSLPQDSHAIQEQSKAAFQQLRHLRQRAEAVTKLLGIKPPASLKGARAYHHLALFILEAPDLDGVLIEDGAWIQQAQAIEQAVATGRRHDEIRNNYDARLIPEAWSQQVLPLRQSLITYGPKWWRFFVSDYRKAKAQLAGLCRQELPKDHAAQLDLVERILEFQRLEPEWKQQKTVLTRLFGAAWREQDWPYVEQVIAWVTKLHQRVPKADNRKIIAAYLQRRQDQHLKELTQQLNKALQTYQQAIKTLFDTLSLVEERQKTITEHSFDKQGATFKNWHTHPARLQDMVTFNHLTNRCMADDMQPVSAVAASWQHAHHALVVFLQQAWYNAILTQAFEERSVLAAFNSETHNQTVERFRALETGLFLHNRHRLALAHWERLPRRQAKGQLGILRREFEKKRRHKPIRKLILNAGNAIQAIKPVFMMSPLSIATYLPPESLSFDLAVFDEASQVKPVDAFGAIIRGKQIVVVGDSKQLPPTSFFDKLVGEEEDEAIEDHIAGDTESILSLFDAQGAPQSMLRWHYRSRHESLIAVSNYEFYDNRLFIFPSPDSEKQELGLIYRYLPNTAYEPGKGRRYNPKEARAVAQAVMEHARTRPDLTLGVAAFSQSQMRAILDQVELIRRQNPSLESFFNAHEEEPFFVKNLENVQGDERDVIFISVGYGKTKEGYTSMNFGPLNRDGGERRLNVLITRARRRCEVFTNLTAADIDLNRSRARGVVALKRFFKYAETAILDVPIPTGQGPDSPFEEAVADALSGHRLDIDLQVGSAGFRIDLAVRDPERPGHYLLGIECDGASYHSAQWARDRDRLRQQVLEGMGWTIHRIWSTDWFRNPEHEIRRVLERVEAARSGAHSTHSKPAPVHTASTSIRRIEADDEVPVSSDVSYTMATVQLRTWGIELHEISVADMAGGIVQVVLVESPVHLAEVTRRIMQAVGVSKAGRRIREAVQSGAHFAQRKGQIRIQGDFLWLPDMVTPTVRDRSKLPASSRKVEMIAPEEIAVAMQEAVRHAHGLTHEEVPTETSRLFGFARTTESMQQHLTPIKDQLLQQGKLVDQAGFVVTPN